MPDALLPIATIPAVPVRTQDDQETFNDKTAALFTALQTSVAGYNANVPALNALSADASLVAAISADVTTLADIAADLTTVAGINANVTTVAGISASVTTVAGIQANVVTVASISTDTTTVADISSDVTTVAGIRPAILTVSGVSASVTTVAGISTDIVSVAANNADITACADNMTAIVNAPTQAANAATSASNAATSASAAAQSAVDAAAIAGITVSETPGVGVTPKSNSSGYLAPDWLEQGFALPVTQTSLPGETAYTLPVGRDGSWTYIPGVGLYVFDAASTEEVDTALSRLPSGGTAASPGRWLLRLPSWDQLLSEALRLDGEVRGVMQRNVSALHSADAALWRHMTAAEDALLERPRVLSGTATLAFSSIAASGGGVIKTVSVPGAALSDPVAVAPPVAVASVTGLVFTAWVSAADVVSVKITNAMTAAVTPASGVYTVFAFRF